MRTPVSDPLFAQLKETEDARALAPTNQPVVLSEEMRAHFKRLEQGRVDHIQRRDRNWDDALRGQS